MFFFQAHMRLVVRARYIPILIALLVASGFSVRLHAEVAEPEPRGEDEFSFMKLLNQYGLHDMEDERWNAYGQSTFVYNYHPAFSAKYTNFGGSTNSLTPKAEISFTGTVTGYFGVKLWDGGHVYLAPEMISETPFSGLKGLGGSIQNFELQKNGTEQPTIYLSRAYLRQTFNLGGERIKLESDPLQLGTTVDGNRLVLTGGILSVLDVFDKNIYSGDLRQQFLNMSFLSFAAYDFAADARGYSFGVVAEYYLDDWTFRAARFLPPQNPNQLDLQWSTLAYYGDQYELEHRHTLFGRKGAVRLLFFHNHENMAKFSDAISAYNNSGGAENATACPAGAFSYDNQNPTAPDLCWARKPNDKFGGGINLEQAITDDIGIFFRGMYSDGQTEVYSYTSTDRSISLGTLISGGLWDRKKDLLGLGYSQGWISGIHAQYLGMGGIDGFIGDGKITQKPEQVVDLFYSYNVWSSLWVSADYQFIAHPAYNADRGPVNVVSGRAHVEF
ncbi:carbohydrate porin [Candidatus Methylospira mobilis]|nr:carbohydrate porin [Candidatus Methylospira mobilis]WNV06196.1 carbohydrate porin [Candidatus Methylospira mobilis]